MADAPMAVVVNRVRPGRADEFERLLSEAVVPAAREAGLADRVQIVRDVDDGEVFVFLLFGGHPDDFDLVRILPAVHGADRGAAEVAHFLELLEGQQDSWQVRRVAT